MKSSDAPSSAWRRAAPPPPDPAAEGTSPCADEPGSVNLLVERRLFKQCWLTLGAGFNTLASLRIEDSDGGLLLDEDLEDAVVLRSGLKWKF